MPHFNDLLNEGFCGYHIKTETPSIFMRWCGYSTIAMAMSRNYYGTFWDEYSNLFPNMYVFLVAHAGGRKAEPIKLADRFIYRLREGQHKYNVIGNTVTVEAMTRIMRDKQEGHVRPYVAPDGTEHLHFAEGALILEELFGLFKTSPASMMNVLCSLYDCPDRWTYKTKAAGEDNLQNVVFNMFCATATEWLPNIFNDSAIRGGLASRTVFVCYDRNEADACPRGENKGPEHLDKIQDDLQHIHTGKGVFKLNNKAGKLYDEWYMSWYQDFIRKGALPSTIHTSYVGTYVARRHIILCKMCMVLMAARHLKGPIPVEIFEDALRDLEQTEEQMHHGFHGIGFRSDAQVVCDIEDFIRGYGKPCPEKEIIERFRLDSDNKTLDDILSQLVRAKVIQQTITNGMHSSYAWVDKKK